MTLKLPRLPVSYTPEQLARWWQLAMSQIEAQFGAVDAALAAQAAADAANTAAAAAQTAANDAQAAADGIAVTDALRTSYVTGLTLTATDAGSDVTVTISAHTRHYGDGTSVSVSGGSITGLAYSTSYWVGYVQPSRAGGSVTYAAATSIQGNGITADYHFVGAVVTPAALGGPVDGLPVVPPGGVIP